MVGEGLYRSLRKVPFARFFLFFVVGIGAGYATPLSPFVFKLIGGAVLTLLLFLLGMEIYGRQWRRVFFPPCFYLLLFLLGVVWIGWQLPAQQPHHFTKTTAEYLVGIVADEPIYGEATIRFPIRVLQGIQTREINPATGQIMLSIARNKNEDDIFLAYGDKLLLRNTATAVRPAYNPKQFDYKRYLAYKNIYHQAYVQTRDIRLIESGKGNNVVAWALKIRKYFVHKFGEFITDRETLGVCSALILGYRANFDAETLAAFINTGTVHVLSVSGLHVGMVFYLLNVLLKFLDRLNNGRSIRFIFILTAIWGYVLLTGMAPPILRAGVMISFLLLAGWSQRINQNINSLFASACCLLLFDPFMLFDMGFQLSYFAVFGLFTFYPLLNKAFRINNRWARAIIQAALVSVSAQLFTTPLALYYFHQFPNYFLLGNLFVMLPATGLMYAGLALAISPFSLPNVYLGIGLTYLSRFLLWGLKAIEELPFATLQGIDLSTIDLVLFLLVIMFLLLTWYVLQKQFLWCVLLTTGMLVFSMAITAIRYTSFQGIKVYNIGREAAIAVINRGKVSLLSTLDSITHPRLTMLVLPDLRHYTREKDITFQRLALSREQQLRIETDVGTIGIMEGSTTNKVCANCDLLLWRNIPYDHFVNKKDFEHTALLLFDASNATTILPQMIQEADSLGRSYYLLKDNFAYVWEKK